MVVFALGGFTCIISILRLQSLLVFLHNSDISWHNPLAAIWSSLEVNIGITCSCLPTLKALVTTWFPRAFHTSSYLRGSDHSNERHQGQRGQGNATSGSSGSTGQEGSLAKKLSFDPLGRGPTHQTVIKSGRGRGRGGGDDDSLEEIEFGAIRDKNGERGAAPAEDQRGIQVVTVVEQEVEKGCVADNKSDAGSEKELVNGPRRGRYV